MRLVVSDDAHGGIAAAAFKHHYDALLDAGVRVWEYPALVHAKVIVSDDRALVGTLNLDAWAMYRNPSSASCSRTPRSPISSAPS